METGQDKEKSLDFFRTVNKIIMNSEESSSQWVVWMYSSKRFYLKSPVKSCRIRQRLIAFLSYHSHALDSTSSCLTLIFKSDFLEPWMDAPGHDAHSFICISPGFSDIRDPQRHLPAYLLPQWNSINQAMHQRWLLNCKHLSKDDDNFPLHSFYAQARPSQRVNQA